jgi:hypothetical protein
MQRRKPIVGSPEYTGSAAAGSSESSLNGADAGPLVSICMPTFNRTTFLRQALESALSQTYANIEIIISDDTQGEQIRSIVEGYGSPKVRYKQNIPALGFVPKLNDFLDEARGEWMVILCDDDAFEPQFVERMVENARHYPQASLLRSRNSRIDLHGRPIQLDPVSPVVSTPIRFIRDLLRPQSETFWVNLSGFMFRPQQLKALGGFADLYAARHTDRLAYAQLATFGDVICDERSLCKIRLHGTSVSSALEGGYAEAINATRTAEKGFNAVLDDLSQSSLDEAESHELAEARQLLGSYINLHVARTLRHTLMTELRKHDGSRDQLRHLRSQWGKFGLPITRLARLIFLVSILPSWVRPYIAKAMLSYKKTYLH